MNAAMRWWMMGCAVALALMMAPALARAQVVARIDPPNVREGESFQFVLEAAGEFPQPDSPKVFSNNVSIISGVASQSLSQSWINGRMRTSFTYAWSFTALKEGPFSIGPITVLLDGKPVEVPPATGIIGRDAFPPAPLPDGLPGVVSPAYCYSAPNPALDRRMQGRVFLVTPPPPDVVYPNQPFPLQTWLYIDSQFLSNVREVRVARPAEGTPFITIPDLTTDQRWNQEVIDLGGRRFARSPIQVTTLAAHSQGAGTVKAPEIEITLLMANSRTRQDPFFGIVGGEQYTARFKQAEMPVTVSPLPPADDKAMAQVVGNFTLGASVDRTDVSQGDLVTMTVTLSGLGYLGGFGLPALKQVPGLSLIDDQQTQSIRYLNGAYVGTGRFQYTFQVQDAGRVEIPGLAVAQFDPATGTESMLTSQPIVLTSAATTTGAMTLGAATTAATPVTQRGEARDLGGDGVLHIDTAPLAAGATTVGVPWIRRPAFWIAHALVLLVALALAGRNQWVLRAEADPARVASRAREQAAAQALAEAQRQVGANSPADFYAALGRAMMAAAGRRLQRDTDGLTAAEAAEAMNQRGVASDVCRRWLAFVEQCLERRYAPDAGGGDQRAADLETARRLAADLRESAK